MPKYQIRFAENGWEPEIEQMLNEYESSCAQPAPITPQRPTRSQPAWRVVFVPLLIVALTATIVWSRLSNQPVQTTASASQASPTTITATTTVATNPEERLNQLGHEVSTVLASEQWAYDAQLQQRLFSSLGEMERLATELGRIEDVRLIREVRARVSAIVNRR